MSITALLSSYPAWLLGLVVFFAFFNFAAIYHAFYRNFPTLQEKMVWLCLAVFVPVLGGVVYFLVGAKRGIKAV
ncbi:hypothetical protein JCM15519_05170 [Fundidesulfovibrio butyratiphilus]